jgi:uncharacterized protein YyaL (SSP411 family)
MLAAFAEAAAVLDRADYRQTAVNNAEFLINNLYVPSGKTKADHRRLMRTGKHVDPGRGVDGGVEQDHSLLQSSSFKVAPIPGFLEDYACLSDGLLRLYEATFEWRWVDTAIELTDQMIELFANPEGGFFNTANDAEQLINRPREVMDNATPSGNSVAIDVLLRLAALTGKNEYRERAAVVLRKLAQALERHPQAFGRLLCAADFYAGPVQELVVIGNKDQSETQEFLRSSRAKHRPNLILACAEPGDPHATDLPLLQDRAMIDGKATAYLCENNTCRQPTTDPVELERQLLS